MNSSPPKEEDQSRVAVPVKEGGLLEPGCLLQTHQKEPGENISKEQVLGTVA